MMNQMEDSRLQIRLFLLMELECIVGLYWLEDSKNFWYFEPMLHIVFIWSHIS